MWRWNYTRYSRIADEEQKKGLMRIYINNFETYTRYSEVADEKIVLGGKLHFLKVAILVILGAKISK